MEKVIFKTKWQNDTHEANVHDHDLRTFILIEHDCYFMQSISKSKKMNLVYSLRAISWQRPTTI